MPPSSQIKMFGELHMAGALRKDFKILLYNFTNGADLSFAEFKNMWKEGGLSSIHNCKVEKIGYRTYLQLVYAAVLLLLRSNQADECEEWSQSRLHLVTDITMQRCVWNVGVIYSIYTVYSTQSVSSHDNKVPINIGPETGILLSSAVQQLSTLAEFGQTAVSMYQNMLKSEAFRLCSYTGPTSLYYSQRTTKSGASAAVVNPMDRLLDSVNRLAAADSYTDNLNSSSCSSSTSNRNLSALNVNAAGVHLIAQVYSMRSHAAQAAVNHVPVVDNSSLHNSDQSYDVPHNASSAEDALPAEHNTTSSGADHDATVPETFDVTEYLTQSIPERRQMRENRLRERHEHKEVIHAARISRLRTRVLQRLEQHDVVEELRPAVEKVGQRRGNRRQSQATHSHDEESKESRGARRGALTSSARHASVETTEPPRRRTRSSSQELPENASTFASRNNRPVSQTYTDNDEYLRQNDDLMQDFEEFVGLRPKSTRSTSSATNNASSSTRGTRATRSAPVQSSVKPEVHLDAATADIMAILSQLEQDSQRVLQGAGSSRASRSRTGTAISAPTAARQVRNTSTAHGNPVRKATSQRPSSSLDHRSAGLGSLELREVNKKRKAPAISTAATRTRADKQHGVNAHEPDDILAMLRSLERDSDRILSGAGVVSSAEEEDEEIIPHKPSKVGSSNRRGANRMEETRQASPETTIRATSKRRESLDNASSTAPAKKPRVQRNASVTRTPRNTSAAPAETLAPDSSDIMALLQRLEQESDQILGGGEVQPSAETPSAVSRNDTNKRQRKAEPQKSNSSTVSVNVEAAAPLRTSRRSNQQTPAPERSSSPATTTAPPVKAPRKAPTKKRVSLHTEDVVSLAATVKPVEKPYTSNDISTSPPEPVSVDMDILTMLKQLEDEANGILSAQM